MRPVNLSGFAGRIILSTLMNQPETALRPPRRPYRPPVGIPLPRQHRVASALASIAVHVAIIFLLLGPILAHEMMMAPYEGAGGPDRAGGGGGSRGTVTERATYIEVAPPPPVQRQPSLQPQIVPPPEVRPPEPQAPATPTPLTVQPSQLPGAGTGGDGSGGTGPGSGGGVGSGSGTGTGSGVGAGTGGGTERVYPPYVTNLALLPIPVPAKVRPYTLVAVFEVDEKGNARLLHFNETKDSGYNRRIRAMLQEVRFRPAVRADGTPVKDTTSITASAPL